MAIRIQPDGEGIEIPVRLPLAEVERLAEVLAQAKARDNDHNSPSRLSPRRLADIARFLTHLRNGRGHAFPEITFGEPAWDMMLALYADHAEGKPTAMSSLCAASGVPHSTALRWIEALVLSGHFIRGPDRTDRRRVLIRLSDPMIDAIEGYLTGISRTAESVFLGG